MRRSDPLLDSSPRATWFAGPSRPTSPASPEEFHDYGSLSDESLMEAYQAGDTAAHRVLFDRLAPLLLAVARRRVGSDEEAHDIVQQTFLNMHRFRADFQTGRRVRPWVTTITMNLVREHHRRLGRRKESHLEERDERVLEANVESAPEVLQRADELGRALEALLENQRRVIELHWFEDKSYDEISQIVGASVSAVRVRAHRGYERMRSALGGQA